MGCKKGKCHRQALLAQFCYEHQKLECCMRKIRKNAEELCKILDSMPPKKEKENGLDAHYFVFCHVSPVPCSFRCTARWSARMNDELKLRNRLKEARTEKALSQAQLAEMVGVSRNTISSIETGQFNPTAKLALVLCIALDKKFEELFYF